MSSITSYTDSLTVEIKRLMADNERLRAEVDKLKQAILAYDDALFRSASEDEQMALHEVMLSLAGRYAND